MDFLKKAQELKDVTIKDRRYFHENAEIGLDLPIGTAYIMKRLAEIGLEAKKLIDCGIVATVGGKKPGKTLLLRADFDALNMPEESDLPFKTKTNYAHMCGHDMNAAMLLSAAQILKDCEDELEGTVKLMFQPAEEIFSGCKPMIEAGVLDGVDAALAMHAYMDAGVGTIACGPGAITSSCDGFKITINGKGCHGAAPDTGIDPINIGVHLYLAMQALIARETPPAETAVLTLGQFSSGLTNNIIPSEAVLQGTLRTYNPELRTKLTKRLREITEFTATTFNATAEYEILSDVPSVQSDPKQLEEIFGYIDQIGYDFTKIKNLRMNPSDDVAFISRKVPFNYLFLGCRPEGSTAPLHNPGCLFDEDALPLGVAIHTQCAYNWLKNNN